MGIFDNFFRGVDYRREEAPVQRETRGVYRGKLGGGESSAVRFSGAPEREKGTGGFLMFTPNSYEDVQDIIDHLKNRESVLLNLKEIRTSTGQRIIDFLRGAIYALNGSIVSVDNGLYLMAPDGVDIRTQL